MRQNYATGICIALDPSINRRIDGTNINAVGHKHFFRASCWPPRTSWKWLNESCCCLIDEERSPARSLWNKGEQFTAHILSRTGKDPRPVVLKIYFPSPWNITLSS
jgi:hypothetical protein